MARPSRQWDQVGGDARSGWTASGREGAVGVEEVTVAAGQAVRVRENDGLREAAAQHSKVLKPAVIRSGVRPGGQGVQEDGHAAAADQAVVPSLNVVQVERPHFGAAAVRLQRLERPQPHFRFDAAAAERTDLAAVRKDKHRGAGLLRRRAARLDHRAVDARPTCLQGRVDLGEKLTHGLLQQHKEAHLILFGAVVAIWFFQEGAFSLTSSCQAIIHISFIFYWPCLVFLPPQSNNQAE